MSGMTDAIRGSKVLEGFTPYDPTAAARYEERRWWLGLTMGALLDRAADVYPRREALVDFETGRRYTYAELRRETDLLAGGLLEQGLKPGDRVLLQLPNRAEFVVSYFALQKAGLVVVLLTVNHSAREVAHLAALTEPRGWIVPPGYRKADFAPLVAEVRRQNPGLETVLVTDGEEIPGTTGYEALLQADIPPDRLVALLAGAYPNPAAVCQILPSGGTTGLPKGAPRTHNDYVCNIEYKSKAWELNVTDTCLVATTVGHNLALLVCVTASVFHGAKMVLLDSTRPEHMCGAIEAEMVTCAGLVPTLISRLVGYEGADGYDLASLQKVYVGAANSPPDLVRAVERRFGCRYTNAFGMVEGPCSQSRPEDPEWVRCETIGYPVCPYDEFRTLDAEGNPTPPGVEGELAARGPGVFTGYFRNPQANQQAFTPDGFFRTGDLATIGEDGRIRITGRLKDIIIRGGENIAARDVEDLLSAHPAVEYVAVVGMPDADLGEQVCAYLTLVPGREVTAEELREHILALNASSILVPARFEFVEAIPLTAAGKADKKLLRQDIAVKLVAPA